MCLLLKWPIPWNPHHCTHCSADCPTTILTHGTWTWCLYAWFLATTCHRGKGGWGAGTLLPGLGSTPPRVRDAQPVRCLPSLPCLPCCGHVTCVRRPAVGPWWVAWAGCGVPLGPTTRRREGHVTNCGMRFEVGGGDASLACAWFVSVFNVENRTRQYFCMYYHGRGRGCFSSLGLVWFSTKLNYSKVATFLFRPHLGVCHICQVSGISTLKIWKRNTIAKTEITPGHKYDFHCCCFHWRVHSL